MARHAQSARFQHHSWSNHFDFVSRGGGYTKDDPIIVWTCLIGHAYLEAFEITGNEWFLRIAESACNWILDLPRERTSRGDCVSYLAHVQSSIHNANMLGASLLARTAKQDGNEEYLRVARSAMEYSCSRQLRDGAWWYAEEPKYHWIDNFHTGYNLDSLKYYIESSGDEEFRPNLERGLAFYKTHFFEEDGCPKYYHTRTYPVDIQCVAQSIDTLANFSDRDPECLRTERQGGCLGDRKHAGLRRLFLLPQVSAREGEDPDAPLGTGYHVQGTGSPVSSPGIRDSKR